MKRITVKPNQTIFDLAAEHYGNCEAIAELLVNNPTICNDQAALTGLGIDYLADSSFYIDAPVKPGLQLNIDNDSRLFKNSVIKEIENEVTTYGR